MVSTIGCERLPSRRPLGTISGQGLAPRRTVSTIGCERLPPRRPICTVGSECLRSRRPIRAIGGHRLLVIASPGKETVLLLARQGKHTGAQGEGGNGDQGVERFHGKDSGHIRLSAGSFRCRDLLNPLQPGRLSCCMGSD
jgi:hypothetical protein